MKSQIVPSISKSLRNESVDMGRGGGRVVSVLVLYPDDPSSNPPEANNSFDVKYVFERKKLEDSQ